MQWALNQCMLAGQGVHRLPCVFLTGQPLSPVVPTGNSLEVLRVLRDGHVDDIQCVLVVLLGREEECQQVEGIGIIPAHFQGLLQLLHGAGDLPEKAANLAIFPKAHTSPQGFGAKCQTSRGHQVQVRPWALGGRAGALMKKHTPKSHD